MPGIIDLRNGVILDAVNLTDWKNVPVRTHLENIFSKPIAFLNDANAAALGEAWLGAGKGAVARPELRLGLALGASVPLPIRRFVSLARLIRCASPPPAQSYLTDGRSRSSFCQ